MTGTAPGYRRMSDPQVTMRQDEDGSILLENDIPLGPYPDRLGDWLIEWADKTPEAPFLAERRNGSREAMGAPWRFVRYGEALERATDVGARLLKYGLGPKRPVMVIAENSIDHAVLMLGSYLAGVPISPISTGYAEPGRNYARFGKIYRTLAPGLILVGEEGRFDAATDSLGSDRPPVLTMAAFNTEPSPNNTTPPKPNTGPDSIAKILFSSGSTGTPKGILNTHKMLCSNQAALAGLWRFLDEEKPVIVDWLPWSHTFGGNHNFHMVLRAGGTIYIDNGRPAPGLIEKTLENLREISPTVYFNVPRGYDLLTPRLEDDDELAAHFFSRLNTLIYAGAGLPRALYDRLDTLANRILGHSVPIGTGWGSTETAPLATMTYFSGTQPPNIGLPCPGTTIKLAPENGRFEIRVKGPNITPGYLKFPDLTETAFDKEGFFQTGDAGCLVDPARPDAGILFDGRLAENFKLGTGSWVNVGRLRLSLLSRLAPLVHDCVITGEHRDEIGLLLFLNHGTDNIDPHRALAAALSAHNRAHPAATTHVGRALIMAEPPSIDAGEITDKGYINQRAVLTARDGEVQRLYDDTSDDIIKPNE